MTAYIISDVSIRNAGAFQTYRMRAAVSIERCDGRYLGRGAWIEQLEGSSAPRNIVIVEFPNLDKAQAWYRSPEYASALEVRDQALSHNLILADSVEAVL